MPGRRAPNSLTEVTRCEDVAVDRRSTRQQWEANAQAWIELSRAGFDVYRDLVNTPAFFELLPPTAGLVGLDIGCGEGHNTHLLATFGAAVFAVDVSRSFVEAAALERRSGINFVLGDGADLPFGGSVFDFATAFMSLMDVGDPERTLHEVARVLKPGGFVQFSVVHPATSTPIRHWVDDEAGHRHALAIGDYFYEGLLTERWLFGAAPRDVRDRHEPFTITYARRTVTGWINAVLQAGLGIEAIAEPHADEQTAHAHPEVADTRIAPYFLILRARKPGP
jgi:SAM-dependent methyltransferase